MAEALEAVVTEWNLGSRFKCKQCDDDEPLKLVPNDGIGLCSTCTTILPAGMVAGCANCRAIVCLACIDNGERFLDFSELLERVQALQM